MPSDHAPVQPDGPTVLLRTSIGPYALDKELGRGGMGVVYRSTAPDGTPVAIKVLAGTVLSVEAATRFRREASVRIDHPNVVGVREAGTASDGTPYIVFELLEGESLEERLARAPLTLSELAEVAAQACAGLQAAHDLGVLHRDLKPGNLFLCADGSVKVLDFGIALPLSQHTRLTTEASLLGTPGYMSPEQARGQHDLDARADLWSLGAVLYEAVSGSPPFLRAGVLATVLATVREEIVPLSIRAPAVPSALAEVIERALRKDRTERFGSAREMRAALLAIPGDALGGRTSTAAPPPEEAGEKRVVAVLLADRVRDPALLERSVVAAGGMFVALAGERAVGVFGAERSAGDEPVRAARAALEAQDAASFLAVSAGRATLRGTHLSGSVLEAAERACAAGFPGVVLDAETAGLLGGAAETVRLEADLVRLLHAGTVDDDPSGGASAASTTLLGREAEVAQLITATRVVTDEARAVVVWIEGPSGIGKTRLRREAERLLEAAPVPFTVLRARADAARADASLAVFASLVRSLIAPEPVGVTRASMLDLPTPEAMVQLVDGVMTTVDVPRRQQCASALGELLGVEVGLGETIRTSWVDPQLLADRIRLAVLDLFECLTARAAVAIVIEDLQWADPASLSLLQDLLVDHGGAPLLLVATSRPELREARPDLFSGSDVVRIEPRGLSVRDVAAMARGLAGRTLAEPLVKRVAERSSGNPLFVEQIVRALDEDGMLEAAPVELPLPLTVEAAVQARLDHLPTAEKELCKQASVVGRPFGIEELEALGVLDPQTLLGSLARRDLVIPAGRARGAAVREYQFRSQLVADVAYRMIPDPARVDLHRRLAAFLDARADADPEEVARHWDRAGVRPRAAALYARAVLAAARRGDGPTVLRCAARSLALGAPEEILCALHLARAEALRFAGRRAEQGQSLAMAMDTAGTDAERAEATSKRAAWLARVGRVDEAVPLAEQAVRIARGGVPDVIASAICDLAAVLFRASRFGEARAALEAAGQVAAGASARVKARLAERRAEIAGGTGELGERQAEYGVAARLYREAGDLRSAARAESNLADVLNRTGAFGEAEIALGRALEACRKLGNRQGEAYALLNQAYALARQGKAAEALEGLDKALALARQQGDVRLEAGARLYEARLRADRGQQPAAAELAEVAMLAERSASATLRVLALSLQARTAARDGRLSVALEHSARALQILEEAGGIEEDEAEPFATRVALLEVAGHRELAVELQAKWQQRLVEIGAGFTDEALRRRFEAVQQERYAIIRASLQQ